MADLTMERGTNSVRNNHFFVRPMIHRVHAAQFFLAFVFDVCDVKAVPSTGISLYCCIVRIWQLRFEVNGVPWHAIFWLHHSHLAFAIGKLIYVTSVFRDYFFCYTCNCSNNIARTVCGSMSRRLFVWNSVTGTSSLPCRFVSSTYIYRGVLCGSMDRSAGLVTVVICV